MKRLTMQALWDNFAANGLTQGETEAEIALQKAAFAVGAVTALGEACRGRMLDIDTVDEFLLDACSGIKLTIDERIARRPYPAASAQ